MKFYLSVTFLGRLLRGTGRSIYRLFRRNKKQERIPILRIVRVFKTRNYCALAVVDRIQPNAVATFRAIPRYLENSKVEFWIWCDDCRDFKRANQKQSHFIAVAQIPEGANLRAVDFWSKKSNYLWKDEFDLIEPATKRDCSYLVTQIIATKLIWSRHDAIDWAEQAKKAIAVAMLHVQES